MQKNRIVRAGFLLGLTLLWMPPIITLNAQTLPVEGLEQQLSELLRLDMQKALENEKRAMQPTGPQPIPVQPAPASAHSSVVPNPTANRLKLLAMYGVGEEKRVLMQLYERVYEMQKGDVRSTSKGQVRIESIEMPCVRVKVANNKRTQELCIDRM